MPHISLVFSERGRAQDPWHWQGDQVRRGPDQRRSPSARWQRKEGR